MDQSATTANLPAFANKAVNAPVNAFYSGIRNRLFLREAAAFCAAAFFLAGGIVLSWKLVFPEWPLEGVISACTVLVAAALAFALYRAIRLTPPKRKLTVWLDANANCGGFLSAALETDCSAWAGKIKPPQAPELVMSFPVARFMAFLTSVVFFAAAFFANTNQAFNTGPGTLDVHEEKEELESKLEILEQEPLVPQEEIEAAREAIAELVENSSGATPARTFEAIDALRNLTDSLAANASRSLEHSAENFERLAQTAAALSNLSPDVPGRSKALEQLKQLAEQLAADDAALAEFLKQSGDNLASSMTPEQLQSLAEQLANGSQDLRERLEKLAQARRDQMMQQQGGQGGQGGQGEQGQGSDTGLANDSDYQNSAEALQQWLEENAPGASELSDAAGQGQGRGEGEGQGQGRGQGQGQGEGQGAGGISRGRGDALLRFTGHTEDVGDERRDLMLENSHPGQSVTIMEFATDPGEETAERARAGNLSGSGEAAEHAETRILPSHRESVRRYFNNTTNQP